MSNLWLMTIMKFGSFKTGTLPFIKPQIPLKFYNLNEEHLEKQTTESTFKISGTHGCF